MRVAGFADEQLRSIDVDEDFAMRADVLAEAMAQDVADGLRAVLHRGHGRHDIVDCDRPDR